MSLTRDSEPLLKKTDPDVTMDGTMDKTMGLFLLVLLESLSPLREDLFPIRLFF